MAEPTCEELMGTSTPTPVVCPRCGGASIPIVYGLPLVDLFEAAERGEVILGGCIVTPDQPRNCCVNSECQLQF